MGNDMRYFKSEKNTLTVGHNSRTPGANPERAIYFGLSGYGHQGTMALSIDTTLELISALQELLDAAAPKDLYVVDTSFGAFQTWARSKEQAKEQAQVWAAKDGGRIGSRVWKVDNNA